MIHAGEDLPILTNFSFDTPDRVHVDESDIATWAELYQIKATDVFLKPGLVAAGFNFIAGPEGTRSGATSSK